MIDVQVEWISFLVVALATLFLIGEILVNAKGIFSVLGLGFIGVYFSSHLDTGMFFIMIALYFVGILLIVIDGKVVNDGTLAVIGTVLMIISVGFATSNWVTGLYAVLGVFIGGFSSLLFLKVFKKRKMWTKITLFDQLTNEAGYSSMNKKYESLIGKDGFAITDMRPIGNVKIDGAEYSAITQGKWVKKDTPIVVLQVDGTRILVQER
ncbi:NfeD family protein [Gracilibacillus marinus]|jgi:membrane-bound ClpP family serine protease|uniref:NfeD family protein n=1 Tax=Gracilibacillus marinus TaxID=630535 RepID=A0ABV8VX02_9BACI